MAVEYVPAGHREIALPPGQYAPAGHVEQLLEPLAAAKVPALQATSAAPPAQA
ncbi:MAG: hypothetical protein ACOZQL_37130 [Myxococcota bacterium]